MLCLAFIEPLLMHGPVIDAIEPSQTTCSHTSIPHQWKCWETQPQSSLATRLHPIIMRAHDKKKATAKLVRCSCSRWVSWGSRYERVFFFMMTHAKSLSSHACTHSGTWALPPGMLSGTPVNFQNMKCMWLYTAHLLVDFLITIHWSINLI